MFPILLIILYKALKFNEYTPEKNYLSWGGWYRA